MVPPSDEMHAYDGSTFNEMLSSFVIGDSGTFCFCPFDLPVGIPF